MKTFLDSQILAKEKLSKVKCGALFMEAGTGKTRVTLELINATDTDLVLWFTPFQTKENLEAEIWKWQEPNMPTMMDVDIEIIGIESIQLSDKLYLDLINKLDNCGKATIVIDESLKIKNHEAKRTNRMLELAKKSEYRLILNGTPLSKNLLDLWSQMHFLSPKILNMNIAEFKNTFCEYIKIDYQKAGQRTYSKEFIKKYHNIDHLYKLIEPFIFESKLSLSIGVQHIDLSYNLSDKELEEHNNLKEKYLNDEYLQTKNNNIFLEITQKMQHNYSLSAEKFRIVDKLLSEIDKSKVIIYAKYIETQKQLKEYYKDVKVNSINKHAYGLNLQDYNIIIFWDKTWDYAQREQTERRVFRTGQKLDCIYYDLTGNVGLETMINKNIAKKRNLLDVFAQMNVEQLKKEL